MPEVKTENSQRHLSKHLDTNNCQKVDFVQSTTAIAGQEGTLAKNVGNSATSKNATTG